ncbi:MAG TPA: helix-turn-helix transcriptional regulator [Thermoleophilaceae bacterium]
MTVPTAGPPNPRLLKLGSNLKAARLKAGSMSQDDLALKAGVSRRLPNLIEHGRTEPKVLTLVKLADALGITAADLLDGVN